MLNQDLIEISKYFDQNEFIINLKKGKTESMILGTAKRLKTANNKLHVSYKGQKINNIAEYKYLGNFVDRNLNFNLNFEKIYKKASGMLKLLKRLRYFLTMEAAYKVYTMMIVLLLTCRGPEKLSFTKTQQDRFSSLERRAKEVIGRSVPGFSIR